MSLHSRSFCFFQAPFYEFHDGSQCPNGFSRELIARLGNDDAGIKEGRKECRMMHLNHSSSHPPSTNHKLKALFKALMNGTAMTTILENVDDQKVINSQV